MRRFARILLIWFVFTLPTVALAQEASVERAQLPAQVLTELRALGREQSTLRAAKSARTVSVSLPFRSRQKLFPMGLSELKAPGYRSEFDDGSSTEEDMAQISLFQGLGTQPGEFLRLSILRDRRTNVETLSGLARVDNEYFQLKTSPGTSLSLDIQPVTDSEIDKLLSQCGAISEQEITHGNLLHQERSVLPNPAATAGFPVIEVATEADREMFLIEGENTNAEILSILNSVAGIYQTQLGLTLQVIYQHVHTSTGQPYSGTNPSTLLNQFRQYWDSNFRSSVNADLVHFFTGRSLDSPVVGIAFIGTACVPGANYGLSTVRVSDQAQVVLTAHEMGHNLGADHDSCPQGSPQYVMCPFVNSSTAFSPVSKQVISDYLAESGSCIGAPGQTPANAAPVFNPVGGQAVAEGGSISFSVTASDPERDSFSISASPQPAGFSFSGSTASYSPGFSVVTGGASSANQVITFTATDSRGASSTLAVPITVTNTNRPPSLAALSNRTIAEGQLLSVPFSASDPDGDALTFQSSNLPFGAFLNRSNGSFRWQPRWNQAGSYTINVSVSDSFGAQASRSFTVTVTEALASPPAEAQNIPTVFRTAGGMWFDSNLQQIQLGLPGDVPLLGDYDGDGAPNLLVWRPSTGMWYAKMADGSMQQEQFGLLGDFPSLADFDNDGLADLIVFRQSTGQFFVRRSSTQQMSVFSWGLAGDIPVVCDYSGDGRADLAVFRPSNSTWYIMNAATNETSSTVFGRAFDLPVPGKYSSSGRCDLAVWEPDTGVHNISGGIRIQFGLPGDIPTSADFTADGIHELIVYRPFEGNWYIRRTDGSTEVIQLGLESDTPVYAAPLLYALRHQGEQNPGALVSPVSASFYDRTNKILYSASLLGVQSRSLSATAGTFILREDLDGNSTSDLTTFLQGRWTYFLNGSTPLSFVFGIPGDIPITFDADGDKRADLTVFRPSQGAWHTLPARSGILRSVVFGVNGDRPVGNVDYNGDGVSDFAIFRLGQWYILDGRSNIAVYTADWGLPGDIPLAGDFDGDGRSDLSVFRAGTWYLRYSGGGAAAVPWGLPGDVPLLLDFFGEGRPSLAVFRTTENRLYVRSLSGVQRSISLPTRVTVRVRGRNRTQTVRLQTVDQQSPMPVN